jgi:hypothetical protein
MPKSTLPQSHCKVQALNPTTPYEQFNSFVLDLPVRCDACHFILNGTWGEGGGGKGIISYQVNALRLLTKAK